VKKTVFFTGFCGVLASLLGQSVLASTFKVMTFNAWLLPSILGVSQDLDLRRNQMPAELAASGVDVIALQEAWTKDDQDFLIREMSALGYPYSARVGTGSSWYYKLGRGLIGNGLLILSKYEIRNDDKIFVYSRYTRTDEYFAAKGVQHVQVNLPELGWVDFYNTHLGAIYFDHDANDWISEHVESNDHQGREMVQFVQDTRTSDVQVILGDLNLHPQAWDRELGGFSSEKLTPLYSWFIGGTDSRESGWVDTFHEMNPSFSDHFTYDGDRNDYALQKSEKAEPKIFCDYVMVNRDQSKVSILDSRLVFDQPLVTDDGKTYYLSDHFGVMTTFQTQSN
jgi:hypothetical protein